MMTDNDVTIDDLYEVICGLSIGELKNYLVSLSRSNIEYASIASKPKTDNDVTLDDL